MLPSLTRSARRSSPISARSASPMGSTTFPRSSRCLSRTSRAAGSSSLTPPATMWPRPLLLAERPAIRTTTPVPAAFSSPSTPTRTGSICRSRTWTASRYYGSSRRRAHPEDRSISITPSVVLVWLPMTTSARGMLVRVSVVVVPDGADVARVGFEEESGDGVDACRRRTADRTRAGAAASDIGRSRSCVAPQSGQA
jgi:hypothetical protein